MAERKLPQMKRDPANGPQQAANANGVFTTKLYSLVGGCGMRNAHYPTEVIVPVDRQPPHHQKAEKCFTHCLNHLQMGNFAHNLSALTAYDTLFDLYIAGVLVPQPFNYHQKRHGCGSR